MFGRYELRELLGRGGMGEVYRAFDTVRNREVAVKVLAAHLAADESFRVRFRRESQVAAQLSDPHIIPIHDFGEIDGHLFLDMRVVEGRDLGTWLRERGPLPVPVALDIVEQVAGALDSAHRNGLVHRDVKPSNVLLTGGEGSRPFAYLVDFGIARPMSNDGTNLTTASGAYGTVAYLAPERIRGDSGDPRTDVYALGCVLFELLTGRRPWDGDIYSVLTGHVTAPPPSVTAERPDCPPAVDAAVRRAMAKRPDDRFAAAGDFARAATGPVRATSAPPTSPSLSPPRTVAPAPLRAPATTVTPRPARPPSRRRPVAFALAGVAVLAAAVITAVTLSGGDGDPSGRRSGSPPVSGSTGPSPLPSGSGSTASWRDFAAFTALVGTRDNDTTRAFGDTSCALSNGKGAARAPAGLVSQVRCNNDEKHYGFGVFRFDTAAHVDDYLERELGTGNYVAKPWGSGGTAFGLRISKPDTAADSVIYTSLCSLPTYLISVDSVNLNPVELQNNVWGRMRFPDRQPAGCTDDFSRASGPVGSAAMSADKVDIPLGPTQEEAFLRRFAGPGPQASGNTDEGVEFMVVIDKSRVHFWNVTSKDGLRFLGLDNYPPIGSRPYSTLATGATARPLPGMRHATFILYGPFATGNPSAALVYTRSDSSEDAWSPAAETSAKKLRFSTGRGTVFPNAYLSNARALVTRSKDGSSTTWKWDGTGFSPAK